AGRIRERLAPQRDLPREIAELAVPGARKRELDEPIPLGRLRAAGGQNRGRLQIGAGERGVALQEVVERLPARLGSLARTTQACVAADEREVRRDREHLR